MSDIDEVKARINIVDLVGVRVKLTRAGRNFKGLCPFHSEKTPSFMVNAERQSWHCFGCGKGGSIFDFVMEFEHVDFREALEELAEQSGVKLSKRVAESPQEREREELYALNHLASEYYHYLLSKHDLGTKAREYLKNRGVNEKTWETFELGYSPNSWEGLFKYMTKKSYEPELLVIAGLLLRTKNQEPRSKNHYYDRWRGRVMFPLKDVRGRVLGFSGRLLDPDIKEAKYINTAETPIYSKSKMLYGIEVAKGAIQKANAAVIVEGEFDVISAFQAGVTNVVAIKGSAFTEGQVQLVRRFAEKVVLVLDSDLAGDAAARRGIEIAERAGLEISVAELPEGKDPDDVARNAPHELKRAITEALSIYDYLLTSSMKRYDKETAFGKKGIAAEFLPFLGKIENPIVQAHYLKKLSKLIDTPEMVLSSAMQKLQKTIPEAKGVKLGDENKKGEVAAINRRERLEMYILALILQGKTVELWEEFNELNLLTTITHPGLKQIYRKLSEHLSRERVFLLTDFVVLIPSELVTILDEALLWDLGEITENEEVAVKEWIKATKDYRKLVVTEELNKAGGELAEAVSGGATDAEVVKLREIYDRLLKMRQTLEKLSEN